MGTQAQFRKKKPPRTYRYDSSLSPVLEYDGRNPAREVGEWLLSLLAKAAALPPPHTFSERQRMSFAGATIEIDGLGDALEALRRLSGPFLNWAGKAERLSFDVPTLSPPRKMPPALESLATPSRAELSLVHGVPSRQLPLRVADERPAAARDTPSGGWHRTCSSLR